VFLSQHPDCGDLSSFRLHSPILAGLRLKKERKGENRVFAYSEFDVLADGLTGISPEGRKRQDLMGSGVRVNRGQHRFSMTPSRLWRSQKKKGRKEKGSEGRLFCIVA